ncbi:MAG: hypothetical protein JNL60_17115 [Bacteroidia bacterium]|nr:hypothetical protein [Bacteroidia bacterium]
MQTRLIIVLVYLICSFSGNTQSSFSKEDFYIAMSSDDLLKVNEQITKIQSNSSISNRQAYLGAAQMKKAGLSGQASEKLNLFKIGHQTLEQAIKKDTLNPELRFMRLIVQENSPKILNYHNNLNQDAAYLCRNYKMLDVVTRRAVLNYCQTSKILSAKDLVYE